MIIMFLLFTIFVIWEGGFTETLFFRSGQCWVVLIPLSDPCWPDNCWQVLCVVLHTPPTSTSGEQFDNPERGLLFFSQLNFPSPIRLLEITRALSLSTWIWYVQLDLFSQSGAAQCWYGELFWNSTDGIGLYFLQSGNYSVHLENRLGTSKVDGLSWAVSYSVAPYIYDLENNLSSWWQCWVW